MRSAVSLFYILAILMTACGASHFAPATAQAPTNTPVATLDLTLAAIPSFTPLSVPCATPEPGEINDFINNSITIEDSGKTFITHITSRFWIYLDDRIYPLRELLNSIPDGLIGYISNGSIRGPQCYPIMFEAVHEGTGLIQIKDFQLSIIVDNTLPASPLPLH